MRTSLIISILLILSPPVHPDTVHTITGAVHEGVIKTESESGGVVIDTPSGTVKVLPGDVYKVEHGPGPTEMLAGYVDRLPEEGAPDQVLAALRFAREHALWSQYRQLVQLYVKRTPDSDQGRAFKEKDQRGREFKDATKDDEKKAALESQMKESPWIDGAFAAYFREKLAAFTPPLYAREAPRIRGTMTRDLARARKIAKAFLRNPRRYPGTKQRPAPGQDKVDRFVGDVRKIYAESCTVDVLREDRKVRRQIEDLEEVLALYKALGGREAEGLATEMKSALARGAALLDYAAADRRRHEARLLANKEAAGPADDESRSLVRVINEYRMMMGVHPISISEALSKAAQMHAEDMVEHGFFAHQSPLPGKRSPSDRVGLCGYPSRFVSEEIAMGNPTPETTLNAWQHSPDHHRGLLNEGMTEIGAGRKDHTWCFVMGNPRVD